ANRRAARAWLARGRLLVSGVRLRDGDADQSIRDADGPVTRREDWSRDQRGSGEQRKSERGGRQVPVLRNDPGYGGCATKPGGRADPGPVDGGGGSAAREHPRVRTPHGEDRYREIRSRAGSPGS